MRLKTRTPAPAGMTAATKINVGKGDGKFRMFGRDVGSIVAARLVTDDAGKNWIETTLDTDDEQAIALLSDGGHWSVMPSTKEQLERAAEDMGITYEEGGPCADR